MSQSIQKLATAGVQALKPYAPGKPLSELEREYGIKHAVKLASNENPLGPGAKARLGPGSATGADSPTVRVALRSAPQLGQSGSS